jgi:O-antigen ligase
VNPWVGVGYESFWLGSRVEQFSEWSGRTLYQAHNGYLETYLNLGLIGLSLIVCNIFSGLLKVKRHLSEDFAVGILRLSLIIVVILYNYTEATFSGVSNMWLLFCIGIIDPPLALASRASES